MNQNNNQHNHCEHEHEHEHNHSHSHNHAHIHSHNHTEGNILVAFLLNFIFVIIEAVGGWFSGSFAILSDAVHDLGDCLAIAFAFVLEKKSKKKSNAVYTYGYRRYSVISALITSSILVAGSALVIYGSITKLIAGGNDELKSGWMLIIAVIGLIFNGLAVLKTSHGSGANEKAINLHMLEDVLGWAVVLIGSILIRIFNLPIIDPILSLCVGLFILYHAVRNIKGVMSVLLETAPPDFDTEEYTKVLLDTENVCGVHHVHIWTLDGENMLATLHAVVPSSITIPEILAVKKSLREKSEEFSVSHITVEIDFDSEECCDRHCTT